METEMILYEVEALFGQNAFDCNGYAIPERKSLQKI